MSCVSYLVSCVLCLVSVLEAQLFINVLGFNNGFFQSAKFVVHFLKFAFTVRFRYNSSSCLTNKRVVFTQERTDGDGMVDVAVEPMNPMAPP